MNSNLQALSDQIFEIKEKCTDVEYKNLMDTLGSIYTSSTPTSTYLNQNLLLNEEEVEDDEEFLREVNETLSKPLRGSKEWIECPIEQKAKWCNKPVNEFKKDENEKPHWMDIEYYKKHPESIPDYLKNNKLLKGRNDCDFCIIC